MSEIAIKVENLSKKYTLNKSSSTSFRDFLHQTFSFSSSTNKEDFWALKDISFEVQKGEILGIIGKNGAGKSTLLKILSRITEPTSGRIEINGKVNSLLEVGTGFHPDLTGRENVFLNGMLLGMKRQEIKAKFDEIVDFSGVEKFIDTPVKHYSSGMYVRLAFAVAAHLETEVLLVDEVLAVGDAEFQKKSLAKIEQLKQHRKTILLVSHALELVNAICSTSICLDNGNIEIQGKTPKVVDFYFQYNSNKKDTLQAFYNQGDHIASILSLSLVNKLQHKINVVEVDKEFGVEITYKVNKECFRPTPIVHLYTIDRYKICVSTPTPNEIETAFIPGIYTIILWFPANFLNSIRYTIDIDLVTWSIPVIIHTKIRQALTFTVVDNLNSITLPESKFKFRGVIRPSLIWKITNRII